MFSCHCDGHISRYSFRREIFATLLKRTATWFPISRTCLQWHTVSIFYPRIPAALKYLTSTVTS